MLKKKTRERKKGGESCPYVLGFEPDLLLAAKTFFTKLQPAFKGKL